MTAISNTLAPGEEPVSFITSVSSIQVQRRQAADYVNTISTGGVSLEMPPTFIRANSSSVVADLRVGWNRNKQHFLIISIRLTVSKG